MLLSRRYMNLDKIVYETSQLIHWKRNILKFPFVQISTKLGGNKHFTILDQKNSNWQVNLDEECFRLTTFNMPFGNYTFIWMPFTILSACEGQQKIPQLQTFVGIDSAACSSVVCNRNKRKAWWNHWKGDEKRKEMSNSRLIQRKLSLRKKNIIYKGRIISEEVILLINGKKAWFTKSLRRQPTRT